MPKAENICNRQNTQAYFSRALMAKRDSFITLTPGRLQRNFRCGRQQDLRLCSGHNDLHKYKKTPPFESGDGEQQSTLDSKFKGLIPASAGPG